jgi:hypothetical protein
MAERRMFALKIIDSDAFLDMPHSTQNLYFHLSMRADDDGFISNPKKIMRMIGATDDDIKLLLAKRFILGFDTGIIVIKHWRLHNCIKKDRYHETIYKEEKDSLYVKKNGAYTDHSDPGYKMDTPCTQNGSPGKARLGKSREGEARKREEAPACADPGPSFSREDAQHPNRPNIQTRAESARKHCLEINCPLPAQKLVVIKAEQLPDITATFAAFTDDKINEALDNYTGIANSLDHELDPPFKRLPGFLATGVEQYVSEANPWDTCRIKGRRAAPVRSPPEDDDDGFGLDFTKDPFLEEMKNAEHNAAG